MTYGSDVSDFLTSLSFDLLNPMTHWYRWPVDQRRVNNGAIFISDDLSFFFCQPWRCPADSQWQCQTLLRNWWTYLKYSSLRIKTISPPQLPAKKSSAIVKKPKLNIFYLSFFLNCLWNYHIIFSYSPQFLQKQHRSLTKNLKTWSQTMSEEKTEDSDILLSIVLTRSTDDKAKPVWERHCKQSFSRNLKIDCVDGWHGQRSVKVQDKLSTYWKLNETRPSVNYAKDWLNH